MMKDIIKAIKQCDFQTPMKKVILPYKFSNKTKEMKYQFLIMIKPECLAIEQGVDLEKILTYFFNRADLFGVHINNATLMNGKYLSSNHIMEKQYKVLNMGAKFGIQYLPDSKKNEIQTKYAGINIIGAYEFLEKNNSVDVVTLEQESHKKGSEKLGNGNYIFLTDYHSEKYGIVNAFHPHQLLHFYDEKNAVITFDCSSNTDYKKLASELVGFFKPEEASETSLRGYIFANREMLGIKNVGTLFNGFHISPSPLEGMFATLRYCSDENGQAIQLLQTKLGSELLSMGYSEEQILSLSNNPYYHYRGEYESIFTLFENNKLSDSIEMLKCYFTE